MTTHRRRSHFTARSLSALGLAGVLALAPSAGAASDVSDVSHDGLHLEPSEDVAIVFVRPGTDFSVYKKILLIDAFVAFQANWQLRQGSSIRRVTPRDMENIKTAMADLLREVFTEKITAEGGYPMVEAPGEDVLLLRPAIVDLEVTSPDVPSAQRSYSFSTSAGAATLYLELFDSVSGQILARVLDRQAARDIGGSMRWQNGLTNRNAARQMLGDWAVLLRQWLDTVHSGE